MREEIFDVLEPLLQSGIVHVKKVCLEDFLREEQLYYISRKTPPEWGSAYNEDDFKRWVNGEVYF